MENYQFLEHPSDIKIRASGKSLPEVIIHAAEAMMAFLYDPSSEVTTKISENVTVEAESLESLLVNWLSDILWFSSTLHSKSVEYQIREFNKNKIVAQIIFTPSQAQDDIKAVTYHDLKISQEDHYWVADVVFDI